MRETLEMVTASSMQNMVQVRKKKQLFRDQNNFQTFLERVLLGLSALRAPTVGPYFCNSPTCANCTQRSLTYMAPDYAPLSGLC